MEAFFIFLLIIAVIWLALRQRRLGHELGQLRDLYLRLAKVDPQPQGTAPLQPAPTPTTPIPTPPPAPPVVHVAPQSPVAAAQHAPPSPVAPYHAPYIPPPPVPVPHTPAPLKPPKPPREHVSLEARLGQNWLNKLGIVTLVIGLALFLGYQVRTLGPLGKSLTGAVLALGILGAGLWLERKPNYRLFARTCIGGGWALTFFLAFAVYHLPALQVITSQTFDLILMIVVAAAMVAHSLRYHSQVVTTLAFLLAFLTVGISQVTLFSLVAGALLAAALAYVVARERWFALGLAGLIGVYLNHFLWIQRVLPGGGYPGDHFPDFIPSAALLLAYWLIFRLVYVFRAPSNPTQQLLTTTTAILNTVGLLGLLKFQSSHPEWAFWGLLVLGVAELVLCFAARPKNRVAFIVLSTISAALLLVAIPFRFRGANWPLLWLLEAEIFFVAGIRLREVVFRRIGILATFLTSGLCLITGIMYVLVLSSGGSAHHLVIAPHNFAKHFAVSVFTAALVLWCNAEFFTRRFPSVAENLFDRIALRVDSYLAVTLAALGLTVVLCPVALWNFSSAFLGVAWLLLALALAEIADRLASRDLSTQSDLLALVAIIRTLSVNLELDATPYSLPLLHIFVPLRALTVGITAALLYLGMRRKTASYILPVRFIAAAYSWLAGGLVALLLWYQLQPISVAVAWGVFALVLFELGMVFRKDYLRYQGYALLAAAFARIFFANMNMTAEHSGLSPSVYTVVPLIAAFSWVYERSRSVDARFDRIAGAVFDTCGLVALITLLYFEVRPDWVILGWTLVAVAVLALAALLKRRLFVAQALALLVPVAARGIFYHIFSTPALAATFFTSRWYTIGVTCALLLLSLPLAFLLRRYFAGTTDASSRLAAILHRPEQPWFFTPLALLTLLLFVQLAGARITIGWSALGVLTFLFALAVKQRSYRLAGLGLLLLGVAKILTWDVWHAQPTERYLTLIIMGAALLLVSFLYSRYRETLLKFL